MDKHFFGFSSTSYTISKTYIEIIKAQVKNELKEELKKELYLILYEKFKRELLENKKVHDYIDQRLETEGGKKENTEDRNRGNFAENTIRINDTEYEIYLEYIPNEPLKSPSLCNTLTTP
jgi:hypothetical protein